MNKEQLEFFKNHFETILKEEEKRAEVLSNTPSEGFKGDYADQSLFDREQKLDLKLIGRKTLFLKKVKDSLKRIEQGGYGECVECDVDIELERLKARPTAHLCISCKEDQERVEGQVLYEKKSHTKGKEISNKNILSFPQGNFEFTQKDSSSPPKYKDVEAGIA